MSSIGVTQLSEKLYCLLDITTSERSNAYLIIGDNTALLFDTGTGLGNIKQMVSLLTKLPVVVVVSHWHHDHVGGAAEFDEVYAWPSAATKKLKTEGISSAEVVKLSGDEYAQSVPAVAALPNLQFLEGEIVFDIGGLKLECLYTPGHTADSICLYEPSKRWLFTGDTFYDGPLYVDLTDSDRAAYVSSINKLKSKPIQLILPGHNSSSLPPEALHALNLAEIG